MTVKEFLTISSIATEPEVIRTKLDELKKPYQLGQYKTPDTLNDINMGGLMNSLKLFPFMPKGILSTDEEVNSATASGMYHVFGRDGISVVSNYSIMIVFNDGQGYVIQMTFRLGEDVVGFRRNYDGKWGDFRSFVLAS